MEIIKRRDGNVNKRIVGILWEHANDTWFSKDMCAYPYYLAKNFQWKSALCYFPQKEALKNIEYEKNVKLINMGHVEDYAQQLEIAKEFISINHKDIDVLMLFNYGGNTYKLANWAKKVNPNIFVWCKLDMSESGFSHFYDGTNLRKIKNIVEIWKSRNIDLFTVENYSFFQCLRNINVFKGRINYLPNGVSTWAVDINKIDMINKENVIAYVGRLGAYEKNAELLLESLAHIDKDILANWTVKIIGPYTQDIYAKHMNFWCINDVYRKHVCLLGGVTDREEVYKILSSAKIICMTSRSESFGIATTEGMYFGAYPVITNYGSIVGDITDNGLYGKIVQGESYKDYAKELETAMLKMECDDSLNKKCKDYARQKFDYDKLTADLNEWLLQ